MDHSQCGHPRTPRDRAKCRANTAPQPTQKSRQRGSQRAPAVEPLSGPDDPAVIEGMYVTVERTPTSNDPTYLFAGKLIRWNTTRITIEIPDKRAWRHIPAEEIVKVGKVIDRGPR